jgi:putative ABC transport system substrate-binding protein
LTADLVSRQVAVIVAPTTPSVLAAKAATKTIPIVFFTAGDPVDLGLVASLRQPDSNLTGATTLTLEVAPKWLQFLHEMVPNAASLALLINPTSPNLAETQSRELQTAARARGLSLNVLRASTDAEFDAVFESIARLRAGGLVISSDSFFFSRSEQLAALATRHSVPTIFGFREFVAAGGLMSYGGSLTESFRWVGVPAESSKVKSWLICLSNSQRKLSCSSISRPPRRSASKFRRRFLPGPTR